MTGVSADDELVRPSRLRLIVSGVAQLLGGVLLAVVLVRAMRRVTGAAPPW